MDKLKLLREADEELAQAINYQSMVEDAFIDREPRDKIQLLEDTANLHVNRAQELLSEFLGQ
jgi:hypothetical protein